MSAAKGSVINSKMKKKRMPLQWQNCTNFNSGYGFHGLLCICKPKKIERGKEIWPH